MDWFDVYVSRLQAAVVSVSEGIHKDAYPKNLEDFLSWVNRFGDHFGGDQSARKNVMQDSSSLAQLHKMLEQEQKALKAHFQVGTSPAVEHACSDSHYSLAILPNS
jgi:hypothetical protein